MKEFSINIYRPPNLLRSVYFEIFSINANWKVAITN